MEVICHIYIHLEYVDRSLCEQEVRELRIKLTEATNRTQVYTNII